MSVSCSHILFAHRNLPNMVFVHLRTIIFDLQCSTISGHVQILYSSSQTYWIVCVLCGVSTECTKSEEDKCRETVRWIHCIASLVPRLISSFDTWEERGNEPGDEWKSLGTRLLHCPHTQFVCMINDLGTMLLKVYILREYFHVITFVQCFPPPNNNKFCSFFGCFHNFSPHKAISTLNYILEKTFMC